MSRPPLESSAPVTDRERQLAAGVHILSIFGPFWMPLIAFFLARGKSSFIAGHALKATFETIVLNLILFLITAAGLIFTVVRLIYHWQNNWTTWDWREVLVRFGIGLAIWLILQGWNIIQSISQAIKAYRGTQPKLKPWMKKLAGDVAAKSLA